MHRRSGRRDVSPVRNRESRRYGPHKISYRILTELKYWRKYYLNNDQFDICDIPLYKPYKKFLDDESLWGEINTDDEDNADEEEIKNEIHVTEINLNILQNASNHHTSDYKCLKERTVDGRKESATLVVRRGQLFSIDMTFDREYDAKKHDLKLQFKSGLDPSPLRGTEITIMVDENSNKFDNSGKWQARVANKMPNTKLEIEVLPPVKCVIGEWDLHVYTISKDKRGTSKQLHRKHDEDIIILFNPWCKEDEVYFPVDPDYEIDVDPREEYVLNPVGSVYRSGQRGLAWRFGQFDHDIVQICLMLVRRYYRGIVNQKMGDAGHVARAISSMVNSNNIDGVLVGKWGAPYDDGVKPWNWIGSTKILKQYHKEERPVRYGQCWVFSGVTVTVCRALGIPCRSVTNYNSAHDTDRTNEIEYLIASDGETRALRRDSVWNFHVWNEVWFTRPDLQDHIYDGWQVIDATPQEMSEGIYQCGPCPVVAVKKGLTHLHIDAGFVFSEVNADMVYYKKTESSKFKRMRTVKNHVGQTISTKKPDGMPMPKNTLSNWTLIDVTKHYKWPEGSLDERTSVARARRYAGSEIPEEKEEVNITIKTAREEFDIGQDVTVFVTVKNTSADTENRMKISSVRLMMSSLDYTGQKNKQIRKIDNQGFYINPGEEKQFDMTVTWDQYIDKLQDMGNFQASVLVNVAKSGNSFPENLVFTLRNPAIIDIEIPDDCKVGTNIRVKFTVVNPLQIPLTKCILKIDDEKFEDHQDVDQIDIAPKSKWTTTLEMKPIRPGRGLVIAALDTKELPDITGFSETDISE